ncbi:hypothetical protein G7K_1147-t1 [Saitoella complicata NRRL Y-17804]|uniref:Uncharacterized protein n=1 Tax=Saitoella complicata (strain BCRC 22490 / CBS 7301 / JCM 7358 / NBRC 10748 / NRRL Y-17804) TaxID=698492 RepID=A0A0E9NAS9_SAICN|nr:hypothetical protein G7K_1147-t1 [Saitoella complicata NRRL Y-17804]
MTASGWRRCEAAGQLQARTLISVGKKKKTNRLVDVKSQENVNLECRNGQTRYDVPFHLLARSFLLLPSLRQAPF